MIRFAARACPQAETTGGIPREGTAEWALFASFWTVLAFCVLFKAILALLVTICAEFRFIELVARGTFLPAALTKWCIVELVKELYVLTLV